jgi:hypothetical protein
LTTICSGFGVKNEQFALSLDLNEILRIMQITLPVKKKIADKPGIKPAYPLFLSVNQII